MANTTHAGHGGKGSPNRPMDPGAVGNGTTEHSEMLSVNSLLVTTTKWTDATDKFGLTVNDNLYNITNNVNRVTNASNTNISNHMNAFNGKATGVEVWYYLGDQKGYQLANKLSSVISSALGLSNRGPKATTDLYVVRETVGTTVLIEWCFIDNAYDMKQYRANKNKAINAVLNVLGYKAATTVNKPQAATNNKPQEKNYYQSGNYFVALQDLRTYNREFSRLDKTWEFKKGSKFAVREIVKMPNGTTHAQVAGLTNTYVTLAKSHVKPQ